MTSSNCRTKIECVKKLLNLQIQLGWSKNQYWVLIIWLVTSNYPTSSHLRQSRSGAYMAKVIYAFVVCSLMHAMICNRLNTSHAVRVMSKYLSNLGKQHWETVQWILKCFIGTKNSTLCFRKSKLGS